MRTTEKLAADDDWLTLGAPAGSAISTQTVRDWALASVRPTAVDGALANVPLVLGMTALVHAAELSTTARPMVSESDRVEVTAGARSEERVTASGTSPVFVTVTGAAITSPGYRGTAGRARAETVIVAVPDAIVAEEVAALEFRRA